MDEAKKKMTGTPVIFFSLYPKTAKPASGSAFMAGQIAPQRLTELPLRAALRRSVASSRLAALKGDFRSAKGAGLADKCNSFGRVPRKPPCRGEPSAEPVERAERRSAENATAISVTFPVQKKNPLLQQRVLPGANSQYKHSPKRDQSFTCEQA